MLSAVIPSERSQPAVHLAVQLAHQRFVRPGPLVLGTALLKSPARTADRDRTVSRIVIPSLLRVQTIPSSCFQEPACYGSGIRLSTRIPILLLWRSQQSRYGGTHTLATQILLDICGGDPLRFRIV